MSQDILINILTEFMREFSFLILENIMSNNDMYIYHYSKEKYSILQTFKKRKELGDVSQKEEKRSSREDPLGRDLPYSE